MHAGKAARVLCLLSLVVWACISARPSATAQGVGAAQSAAPPRGRIVDNPVTTYRLEVVDIDATTREYRLYRLEQHFLSAILQNGAISVRPHPGVDVNGWGSTWYPQPFLPGATLSHTRMGQCVVSPKGITLRLSGKVSSREGPPFGRWMMWMRFAYSQAEKKIDGSGTVAIFLDGQLSDSTGDLNLCKIASNYLDDVPLLPSGLGDTGDMESAEVTAPAFQFTWIPELQPAHFPQDVTDCLTIDVKGQYNNVDTQAQGHPPIAPAWKPNLKLTLMSRMSQIPMIFGAMYDTSKATEFWADNVGITPLVLKTWHKRVLVFRLGFESTALPGDGGD